MEKKEISQEPLKKRAPLNIPKKGWKQHHPWRLPVCGKKMLREKILSKLLGSPRGFPRNPREYGQEI